MSQQNSGAQYLPGNRGRFSRGGRGRARALSRAQNWRDRNTQAPSIPGDAPQPNPTAQVPTGGVGVSPAQQVPQQQTPAQTQKIPPPKAKKETAPVDKPLI